MTSNSTDISLKNFFIYNTSLGQNEHEEEEKILYFYPQDSAIDIKMKEVGLSEAIIKFTETFSSDLCEALQTKKTRKLFLQPEPGFWVVMTILVPTKWDALEGIEYNGKEVQLPLYEAALRQAYLTSKLFIGSYHSILTNQGPDSLQKKLDLFFTRYLRNMRLKGTDVISLFQGVRFLPLDKPTFLHSQSFINSVEAEFPMIEFTLLLFNDELIWSGVGVEDAQVIYRYLVSSLLPSYLQAAKTISTLSISRAMPTINRFVSGPDTLNDNVYINKVPEVYLSSTKNAGPFYLVVYKYNELTLAMLIPSKQELKIKFYRNLDTFLSPKMDRISKEIRLYNEHHKNSSFSGDEPVDAHYVYFNTLNLATKSSLQERKNSCQTFVAKEVLNTLINMHQDQLRLATDDVTSSEHIVKFKNDRWLIGRMSNSRHFYITLERKKKNLVEISEEVKKIWEKQLKNIFFHL